MYLKRYAVVEEGRTVNFSVQPLPYIVVNFHQSILTITAILYRVKNKSQMLFEELPSPYYIVNLNFMGFFNVCIMNNHFGDSFCIPILLIIITSTNCNCHYHLSYLKL